MSLTRRMTGGRLTTSSRSSAAPGLIDKLFEVLRVEFFDDIFYDGGFLLISHIDRGGDGRASGQSRPDRHARHAGNIVQRVRLKGR